MSEPFVFRHPLRDYVLRDERYFPERSTFVSEYGGARLLPPLDDLRRRWSDWHDRVATGTQRMLSLVEDAASVGWVVSLCEERQAVHLMLSLSESAIAAALEELVDGAERSERGQYRGPVCAWLLRWTWDDTGMHWDRAAATSCRISAVRPPRGDGRGAIGVGFAQVGWRLSDVAQQVLVAGPSTVVLAHVS